MKFENEIALDNVVSLLTVLKKVFDDSNKKTIVQREFRSFRQRNREFHIYFSNFQRLTSDINFDEEAQRSILLNEVSDEFKQLMIIQNISNEFNE